MELLTRKEVWNITYNHALGATASEFFYEIKENGRIMGRRCPSDGRVLVPPRAFSDESLEATDEWIEVGPGGRIEAFTITYEPFQNLPEPPYAFGYVLLDGASTAIGGYFKGVDLSDPAKAATQLAVGTRVEARFAEKSERIGDVLDFWFEIVK